MADPPVREAATDVDRQAVAAFTAFLTRLAEGVPALTLRQPWAWLVTQGKNVENRTPHTGKDHRGLLAIHAGHRTDTAAMSDPRVVDAMRRHTGPARPWEVGGAVVAVTNVVGVHRAVGDCCPPWGNPQPDGLVTPTPYHWRLTDTQALPQPVPCRGKRGRWTLPASVAKAVLAQVYPTPESVA